MMWANSWTKPPWTCCRGCRRNIEETQSPRRRRIETLLLPKMVHLQCCQYRFRTSRAPSSWMPRRLLARTKPWEICNGIQLAIAQPHQAQRSSCSPRGCQLWLLLKVRLRSSKFTWLCLRTRTSIRIYTRTKWNWKRPQSGAKSRKST